MRLAIWNIEKYPFFFKQFFPAIWNIEVIESIFEYNCHETSFKVVRNQTPRGQPRAALLGVCDAVL